MLVATNYFYVGGKYVGSGSERKLSGHMYVQSFVPAQRKHRWPVVLVHGNSQSGNNFIGTVDGRPGWAHDFAARGYTVYVVDQVGRGRSGTFASLYGEYGEPNFALVERLARAPDTMFPTAKLNTQWPDKGVMGEPCFDQFVAQQMPSIRDATRIEELNAAAQLALLEKIGPAILVEHSQAGVFGWKVADTRPDLVKALVAIEPNGPPFYENTVNGPPSWFKDGPLGRPWGITRGPLTFSPAAADPKDLRMTQQAQPSGPDLVRCWLPASPAPQLPNLKGIPILIVTSEASYHAPYDHCTSEFLKQAGVKHDFVRLTDLHIHGNGHMMMLEKNSSEVAGVLMNWLESKGL